MKWNSTKGERIKRRFFGRFSTHPCALCGDELTFKEATLDHIVPRCFGGKSDFNLQIACLACNQARNRITKALLLAKLFSKYF